MKQLSDRALTVFIIVFAPLFVAFAMPSVGFSADTAGNAKVVNGKSATGFATDAITIPVQQYVYGQASLQIDPLLDPYIQGRPVEAVTIRMAGYAGSEQAAVFINGAVTADGWFFLSRWLTDYSFRVSGPYPGYRNRIQLRAAGGDVYVESVTVYLGWRTTPPDYGQPNPPPPPAPGERQTVTEFLNQYFYGQNHIHLERLLDLDRFQGYWVDRVILVARDEGGRQWGVGLTVNGYADGPYLKLPAGGYLQRMAFYPTLGRQIGRDLLRIGLELNGRFMVESVTVELSARSGSRYAVPNLTQAP